MAEGLTFSNPKVQRLRRLLGRRSARSDEGVFVVEGPGLVAEAVRAGWEIEGQYLAPGAVPVEGAGPALALAPGVIERVATTEHPQPVLAVVHTRTAGLPEVSAGGFLVVADRLADPGNLGTILRSAEAAGAAGVVLTPGSVDLYNPKVVRASAGAVFWVPVAVADLPALGAAGWPLVGTSSHHGDEYGALQAPCAVVFGNEAHGLEPDAPVRSWITIPHQGRAESLNVAMAATVVCFSLARARANRRPSGG